MPDTPKCHAEPHAGPGPGDRGRAPRQHRAARRDRPRPTGPARPPVGRPSHRARIAGELGVESPGADDVVHPAREEDESGDPHRDASPAVGAPPDLPRRMLAAAETCPGEARLRVEFTTGPAAGRSMLFAPAVRVDPAAFRPWLEEFGEVEVREIPDEGEVREYGS